MKESLKKFENCPSCGAVSPRVIDMETGKLNICRKCRLQWALDIEHNESDYLFKDQSWLDRPFRNRYVDPASIGEPSQYKPFVSFFHLLKRKFNREKLTIIDVGCGNGVFINECLRRGHEAFGIEQDKSWTEMMSPEIVPRVSFVSAKELNIIGLPQPDIITFWDSFEHMIDGFQILEQIKNIISSDGGVFLRVNNNRDVYNLSATVMERIVPVLGRELYRHCFGFPEHVWNFSFLGMENLLKKHGWEIDEFKTTETPSSRLSSNICIKNVIRTTYLINRIFGWGKIGEYYIKPNSPA